MITANHGRRRATDHEQHHEAHRHHQYHRRRHQLSHRPCVPANPPPLNPTPTHHPRYGDNALPVEAHEMSVMKEAETMSAKPVTVSFPVSWGREGGGSWSVMR